VIATPAVPVPLGGAFYDRAVDAQLAEGRQHLGMLAVSFVGGAGGRSGHFDDREFARHHRVVPAQSLDKVRGFGLGDDKFHQCGGVDVRDQRSPARCSASAALIDIASATTGDRSLQRSPCPGRNWPAAMRPANGVLSGRGASSATGRPCSVTSSASPAVTRRR